MHHRSPQAGLERAWQQLNNGQRSGDESRFEAEAVAFHEKVRAGYLELASLEPERFRIEWVSAAEADRFAEVITDTVEKIRKLGPSPYKI